MKNKIFLIGFAVLLAAELAALIFFAAGDADALQDAVLVNEAVRFVEADWGSLETHQNRTSLDYVVLDLDGAVLYWTKSGLSASENQAVVHRDTVLALYAGDEAVGKIIIFNDSAALFSILKNARSFLFFRRAARTVRRRRLLFYLFIPDGHSAVSKTEGLCTARRGRQSRYSTGNGQTKSFRRVYGEL